MILPGPPGKERRTARSDPCLRQALEVLKRASRFDASMLEGQEMTFRHLFR